MHFLLCNFHRSLYVDLSGCQFIYLLRRHELIVPVYIKTDVPKTNVSAILSKE